MSYSRESIVERTRFRFISTLLVGDLLAIASCMLLGFALRFGYFGDYLPNEELPSLQSYWDHALAALVVYVLIAHGQRLFRWSIVISRAQTFVQMCRTIAIWSFSVLGLTLMLGFTPDLSRFYMLCVVFCTIPVMVSWRLLMHVVLHRTNIFHGAYRSVAIVGRGTEAQKLKTIISSGRAGLHRFVGYIDRGEQAGPSPEPLIGQFSEIKRLMKGGTFDCVIVADQTFTQSELIRVAKLCEQHFIDFKSVPNVFEVFSSCLQMYTIGELGVMGLAEMPQNRVVNRIVKRSIDIVGAMVGLAVSLPFYVFLIPLIKRESPGPILYKQVRSGQGGKTFGIYKLRSMKIDAESNGKVGWSTEVDPRRTKIGTFMRKWNLDELPQFWNVLKGEMSLVGPRPERPELVTDFLKDIPYYQSRHSVKPGMTGWAQVNGLRGDTSISERIRYDLQYIENWSVWMDFSIQFRTIFNYKGAC